MLPSGASTGGLDNLRHQTQKSTANPVGSLNDSVRLLTSSVNKLNDAIIDLVDISEDASDNTTSSGRNTKRKRQRNMNAKFNTKGYISLKDDSAEEERRRRRKDRQLERVPYVSYDSEASQRDMRLIGNMVTNLFEKMTGPLRRMASDKDKESERGGITDAGLAALGVAGLLGLGTAAAAAVSGSVAEGMARGRAGTGGANEANERGPANQQPGGPQRNFGRRGQGIYPPESTPDVNPMSYSAPNPKDTNDAEPADDLIDALEKRFDGLNDLLTPVLNEGAPTTTRPLPQIYTQPGMPEGPTRFNPGTIPRAPTPPVPAAPTVAPNVGMSVGRAVLGRLAGLLGLAVPGFNVDSTEDARMDEINRTHALRRQAVPNAPPLQPGRIDLPEAPPVPAEPTNVPMPAVPGAPPVPAPPTIPAPPPTPTAPPVPNVPAPTPTVVPTPAAPPAPAAPTIAPSPPPPAPVMDPHVAAAHAVPQVQPTVQTPSVTQSATTTPTPTPPPTGAAPRPTPIPFPPIPPAMNRPPVIIQQSGPPPYIPPQLNPPRAIGGANIGRAVGFAPLPPSPPSPTARTPSYPNRGF